MNWIILIIFGLVGVSHLLGEFFLLQKKHEAIKIRYFTKPFIMSSLALYYLVSMSTINWWLLLGILGGLGGDVLLMLPDPEDTKQAFKFGLISFLLGHIFYIVGFATQIRTLNNLGLIIWIFDFLILLYGIIIARILLPHTGKLKIPVLIYVAVIIAMAITSTWLHESADQTDILIIIIGSIFFMLSDTINAYNRFVKKIPAERLITMSTYIIGQFLIVFGYVQAFS